MEIFYVFVYIFRVYIVNQLNYLVDIDSQSSDTICLIHLILGITGGFMGLIKITDLTSKLGISSRSLRYYEQMNLIKSVRPSNEKYRYYDIENIALSHFCITVWTFQTMFYNSNNDSCCSLNSNVCK